GDEVGRLLLLGPADLADHDDGSGRGVGLEGGEAVDERRARHRVASDADAGGDPDVLLLQLVEGLVGKGARAADDAHRAARLGDRGEDGDAVDVGARLLRVRAGHHAGAVRAVAQAVEAALRPGEALVDDLRLVVHEDAHPAPPASSTARRAASSIVGSEINESLSSALRILRTSSALVPSRRMTIGASMATRPS